MPPLFLPRLCGGRVPPRDLSFRPYATAAGCLEDHRDQKKANMFIFIKSSRGFYTYPLFWRTFFFWIPFLHLVYIHPYLGFTGTKSLMRWLTLGNYRCKSSGVQKPGGWDVRRGQLPAGDCLWFLHAAEFFQIISRCLLLFNLLFCLRPNLTVWPF